MGSEVRAVSQGPAGTSEAYKRVNETAVGLRAGFQFEPGL